MKRVEEICLDKSEEKTKQEGKGISIFHGNFAGKFVKKLF